MFARTIAAITAVLLALAEAAAGAPPGRRTAHTRTRASADLSFDFVIGDLKPALGMVCPNTLPGINGSKRRGGGTRFAGRIPQPART